MLIVSTIFGTKLRTLKPFSAACTSLGIPIESNNKNGKSDDKKIICRRNVFLDK